MKTNITNFFLLIFMFISNKSEAGKPKFSAIFVFGDSFFDTGNNNYLHTKYKADYYPYGVDFPTHNSTGRFSNGKVLPDVVSSLLGIKEFVPPFLNLNSLSNHELVTGVNFASAGSGFDDFTTLNSNGAPVSEQLFFFGNYLFKLTDIVGENGAMKIVNDSLVIISAGTLDWIVNYYNPPYLRKHRYSIEGYAEFLVNKIQSFVQQLYDIGCRNIVVVGVPPIGCLPYQRLFSGSATGQSLCVSSQVLGSITYNGKLQDLIATMRSQLADVKLFYANVFDPLFDMINAPTKYGFVETMKGCCVGSVVQHRSTLLCDPEKPCRNPSQYIFWDNIHPTEIVNKHLIRHLELTVFRFLK